ncbi:ricin-type beta-trefoil lectin domain protein [Actinoplanes sp. N902-109]|uniref:ricin-type beta-trefoil lectin domain protein n=1 Tax=Actinoplanes sp. (strain N902-109) TaxID=649831 RepID=UPI0003293E40|nr:ricin-type beta-trefoil lectin domain protein [Actinoplanes sp. N902-109]AGL16786.1 xylanase A [Actinoplanes sp. N902-109]
MARTPAIRILTSAMGLLLAMVGAVLAVPAAARAATTITVNGGSGGRVLDGIGAISGGGGNSRLLVDYPEPQRSDILDYLFKPGYGAALQIMKVEIGGDTNSTSGAEPSHEHTRGAVNCDRGYEWWLMGQAKARNPGIKLVGLSWGAPGWIGNGTFFTSDSIDYLIAWLGCAASHGLTIDYLGGWNERGRDLTWYKNLRSALNSRGYPNVKIVAADEFGWAAADDAQRDPAFASAVSVFGSHYVCGYRSAQTDCPSSTTAVNSGKPLWASENGSDDYNGGAQALARGINRDYLDGRMTAYLNWPLIAAITPNIPWSTTGLAVAAQPWSGAYSIGKNAWVMAQTTQFTAPGWRYLDSSSGYLNGTKSNGSYVSLRSGSTGDYSTVIETMDAGAAQDLSFTVTGGLSTGTVHVWSTNVRSSNPADYFVKRADITPVNGSFSLNVQPGYVYSVTTTTGQGKGTAASPAQGSLALPYADDFDSYASGREAKYLMDHQGSFEVVGCAGGRSGQCVRQMSEQTPIYWTSGHAEPFSLLGDLGWRNYTVSSDVLLEKSGYAQLIGRASTYNHEQPQNLNAYYLRVADNGQWSIRSNSTAGNQRTLASGSTAALGTGRWHKLALTLNGSTLSAAVDGTTVGSVTDSTWVAGQVGYATGQGVTAQFDNLSVTPVGGGQSPTGEIRGVGSNRCLDVNGQSQSDGAAVQIWDCNGGTNQRWTPTSSGQLTVYGTKCLDAPGTTAGTAVRIFSCTGGTGQQWRINGDGTITGVASGLCLDVTGAATANGTPVALWTCNGGTNQQWLRN